MARDRHTHARQSGLVMVAKALLVRVFAPVLAIVVCSLVAMGLLAVLEALRAHGLHQLATGVSLFSMGLVCALPVLLLVGVVVWRVRSERSWSASLSKLGLVGSVHRFSGRQYHGVVDGRVTEAFLQYGPVFELFVEGRVGTRIRFGLASALVNAVQGPGQPPPQGLEHLHISDHERDWLAKVLAEEEVRESLVRLTRPDDGLVEIYLRPDGVLQRVRGAAAMGALNEFSERFARLLVLLEAAEAHRPEQLLEPTPVEAVRGRRWGLPGGVWGLLAISLGVAVVFSLVLIVLVGLVAMIWYLSALVG